MFFPSHRAVMPTADKALPDRPERMPLPPGHFVNGRPLDLAPTAGQREVLFGMGCFWGAERLFWTVPGVVVTAVGYAGGFTANASYRDVCTGLTGHNEVVRVVFDPSVVPFSTLLRLFWEGHNPTEGMRQGNDHGTQYRSGIYASAPEMRAEADGSRIAYQRVLTQAGLPVITTEILQQPPFYFAEAEHQQYLAKNPKGYCGLGGTGVACPVGLGVTST